MVNKKLSTLMATAELWAQESYCDRKKVGAVLAKDDRILATGYNGTISGLQNRCEEVKYLYNKKGYDNLEQIIQKYKIKFLNVNATRTLYTVEISFHFIDGEIKTKRLLMTKEEWEEGKEKLKKLPQDEKLKYIANKIFEETVEKMLLDILKYTIEKKSVTSETTLHAEQNVITFCAKNGIPTAGTEMFITLSPCKTCAKLIAQAGISKVYYKNEYRDTTGIDFLKEIGVRIEKIS